MTTKIEFAGTVTERAQSIRPGEILFTVEADDHSDENPLAFIVAFRHDPDFHGSSLGNIRPGDEIEVYGEVLSFDGSIVVVPSSLAVRAWHPMGDRGLDISIEGDYRRVLDDLVRGCEEQDLDDLDDNERNVVSDAVRALHAAIQSPSRVADFLPEPWRQY